MNIKQNSKKMITFLKDQLVAGVYYLVAGGALFSGHAGTI